MKAGEAGKEKWGSRTGQSSEERALATATSSPRLGPGSRNNPTPILRSIFPACSAIAAARGLAAAVRLAGAFGGKIIYVLSDVDPNHAIAKAIGVAEAQWLSSNYGGERLEVPLGPFTARSRLFLDIYELLKQGLTEAEISKRLRCHIRTVRRQRANGGGDPRKLQLLRRVRELQTRDQR
jgi:hypothetical protein